MTGRSTEIKDQWFCFYFTFALF